jgi:hypothetical protein
VYFPKISCRFSSWCCLIYAATTSYIKRIRFSYCCWLGYVDWRRSFPDGRAPRVKRPYPEAPESHSETSHSANGSPHRCPPAFGKIPCFRSFAAYFAENEGESAPVALSAICENAPLFAGALICRVFPAGHIYDFIHMSNSAHYTAFTLLR